MWHYLVCICTWQDPTSIRVGVGSLTCSLRWLRCVQLVDMEHDIYIHDMPCLISGHLPQSDIQPFTVSRFVKSTCPKMQSSSSNPQLWNSWNPSRIRYNISFVHQKSLSFPNYESVITKTLKPPGFQTKPYCIQWKTFPWLSTVLEDHSHDKPKKKSTARSFASRSWRFWWL